MSEAMRTTVESCGIGGRHANRGVAKGQHAEDVVAIHHETTSGTSLFAWADEILTDAAGRITRAHLYSHGSGTYATASYRTDGRVDTFNVPRRTGSSTYVDAMDREYTYSLDGSSMGWATNCADDEDRTFLYDGANRLVCATDDAAPITVHYDHRARPYLVTVTNEDTDVTETNRYYYDLEDNLLGWIRTPDLGTATTYDERQYVRIGEFAIGEMARSWVSGSTTRHTYIHTTAPLGLETAAFEFEHPGGASVSYNPSTVVRQWSAFGRPLVATGSGVALPTRFPGQLELRGTDVRIWSSGSNVAHRDGLYLNRWRVYDPRVGQYLQPDPAASDGHLLGASVFVYGDARPADEIDPTGRVGWVMCWCGRPARNLLECVAVCWGPDPSRAPAAPDEDPPKGADTEEWEECLRSWTWCQGRHRLRRLAGRRGGTDCNTCLHLCRRDGSWNTRRCKRPPPAPAPQQDCDPFSVPMPVPVPVPVPVF